MKQAEIGLIPEDWEVKSLGDSVDILRGGSPRPIENYLTTNADGINWIKIGDVKPNDKYIRKTEEKIIPEGKSRSREVKKGDFILSNSMSFGRPYILAIDGCVHDGWLTIQKYAETFDKEFLYYLLGSDEVFNQYVQMAAGSSVQNLNKDKVTDLQLKIPPLPEQQRIAKALSDVDALISTTEKLIQKKKNIKQGAMQNLLTGKKRLPGFGDKQTDLFVPNGTHTKEVKDVSPEQIRLSAKMKQTELGEIPEDWEVKTLGEMLKIGHGKDYKNLKSGNVPVYGTGGYMTSVNDFLYEGETVCIGGKGTIDKPQYHSGKIWTVDTLFYTYDFKSLNPKYLFYKFCLIDWLSMNEASGVPSLTAKNIEDIQITIPTEEEQTTIANVLSSMDKEIETLNTKLEKYRNLKIAMMQQLLTGKIRLVNI